MEIPGLCRHLHIKWLFYPCPNFHLVPLSFLTSSLPLTCFSHFSIVIEKASCQTSQSSSSPLIITYSILCTNHMLTSLSSSSSSSVRHRHHRHHIETVIFEAICISINHRFKENQASKHEFCNINSNHG